MPQESEISSAPELTFSHKREGLDDLRLDTELGIKQLQYAIEYPPDAPPLGASETLRQMHESLMHEQEELVSQSGDVQSLLSKTHMSQMRIVLLTKIFKEFRRKKEAYEKECMKSVMPQFLSKLGISDADPDALYALCKELAVPLEDVPRKNDKRFTDSQRKDLKTDRDELEIVRLGSGSTDGLATCIEKQLLQFWMGTDDENTEQDWLNFRKTLAIYVARKQRYEAEILLKKPVPPMWAVFAGILAQEGAEEGVEALQFGKKPALLRASNISRLLPGISAETRIALLAADKRMNVELLKRGVTKIPRLGDVLKSIDKTPFGSKMFRQMLTIESPFTVLFYAYYLHSSDNKIKATMEYATFMAGSAGIGAILETAELWLQSERALALVSPKAAPYLKYVAKVPGNPIIKISVAIGLMYAGREWVDWLTTWVDEKIPHSAERFGGEMVLSMISGDTLLNDAMFAYQELNPTSIDPERDRFAYLSTELPTIDSKSAWDIAKAVSPALMIADLAFNTADEPKNAILDSRFMNDEQAWNGKVQAKIEGPSLNVLGKKLWELEKIDAAWYPREAAHLYEEVLYLQRMELEIGTELTHRTMKIKGIKGEETIPVLKNVRSLNLSEEITADSGYLRMDRILPMMLANPAHAAGRINAYMKTLPESDTLQASWKEYLNLATRIAKSVTIYRNLKDVYDRKTWLGSGKEVPPMVENGYIEELVYVLKRHDIFEKAATVTKASAMLCEQAGLSSFASVFSTIDVRDPTFLSDPLLDRQTPMDAVVGIMLKNSFASEIRADERDGSVTAFAECIIPESGEAILSLTTIIPKGSGVNDWRVHIYRKTIPKHMRFDVKQIWSRQREATLSSEEKSLSDWTSEHPQTAALLKKGIDGSR